MNQLRGETASLKARLIEHALYDHIKTIDHLKVFMEHHVFAVWDFMSLLKILQQRLTSVEVPWVPKGSALTRHLINEIVAGEESDIDQNGNYMSHFELYLNAMREIGCDMRPINNLLLHLSEGNSLREALNRCEAPASAVEFVNKTFEVVHSSKTHVQAAVFTFGREDLVPGMFLSFVRRLSGEFPKEVNTLRFYLERHIAVDGERHSPLAFQMTDHLCEMDSTKWSEATVAVKEALNCRIKFWDKILESLLSFPESRLRMET